jgi:hypothetical protein
LIITASYRAGGMKNVVFLNEYLLTVAQIPERNGKEPLLLREFRLYRILQRIGSWPTSCQQVRTKEKKQYSPIADHSFKIFSYA